MCGFGGFPGADIPNDGRPGRNPPLSVAERAGSERNRNWGAVPAKPCSFHLVYGVSLGEEPVDSVEGGTPLLGHEHRQGLSHRFLGAIAVQSFGAPIPTEDNP